VRSPITRVAELDDAALRYDLPAWSLRLPVGPGGPRYVFVGQPDFSQSRAPWRYVEQMGEAHRLEGAGLWLTVVTRSRGPLTEARMVVEPAPP
jgi:hypothetical protein